MSVDSCWGLVCCACTCIALFQRFYNILLIVLRASKAYLCLLRNMRILLSRLQAAVNLSKITLPEIGLRFVRRPEVCQATALSQKANIIAGTDIVRSVCHQDDSMSLVGQFAQQEHHFAVQARIETGGRFVAVEEAGIRQ